MSNPVTKSSEQEIDNQSFDPTYQLQQVEIIGYDSANGVMRPLAVDSNGNLLIG